MKNLIFFSFLFSCIISCKQPVNNKEPITTSASQEEAKPPAIEYGKNGQFADVNGIKMYYEIYGEGEPMVIIHGNGEDISKMSGQIKYFQNKYKVIVANSRGHGQSEMNTDDLNLAQMAKDWNDLLEHLQVKNANIYGFSDGGNIAMIIARDYPDKVKKLAIMGSNLRPDASAVYPWAIEFVANTYTMVEGMIEKKDTSASWTVLEHQLGLLKDEPNFPKEDLKKIEVPVLVMAADKDIIKEEHTVEMYQGFPNAHLVIFPGETHFVP